MTSLGASDIHVVGSATQSLLVSRTWNKQFTEGFVVAWEVV